ncbi:nitroreductase family deazaflavin-dependent oxidoreductase [Haliea atlantica]|nr:nitroreductase [Haliea sp.]MAL95711.1 nitroreductase [Haliea sp.]|tara:strand:- start:96 stop:551 length:456 start_codon:yes stop_codon:yes gene_type:complete
MAQKIPDSMPDWIREHIELYRRDPEKGHFWDASLGGGSGMLTTLLLTTTGRKSGEPLTLPLIYRPTNDGNYCVIASKGGAPAHPAWYLNLQANPRVEVQVASDRFPAMARDAVGEEREKLWEIMVNYYAPYTKYQAATERRIPVVVLEPIR